MAQMGPQAAEPMKQMPMYEIYSRSAPRPQDWPTLLAKIGELLLREYDWTKEVAALKTPTLVVAADGDSVRTAHVLELVALLAAVSATRAGTASSARPRGSRPCRARRTTMSSCRQRWRWP
jgi:hypothetical protein